MKEAGTSRPGAGPAEAVITDAASAQRYATGLLADHGWQRKGQRSCLVALWDRESGWDASATNPSSGAHGIPQALPPEKMAAAGPRWRTDAATQIRWGLGYIAERYGSPCAAWEHSQSTGWY